MDCGDKNFIEVVHDTIQTVTGQKRTGQFRTDKTARS
jgi:hypothetical protein